MNKLKIWVLILTLLTLSLPLSGCLAGREAKPAERIIRDLTVEEAAELLRNNTDNPDFVLLDVRTPEEFADERLDKAVNLDYYARNFREELSRLDRDKLYLVYCRTGRRSGLALRMMDELRFKEAYNMIGGIVQWKAEGLPVFR